MTENGKSTGLSAEEAREALAGADGGRVGVVDLRSGADFAEGHLPTAMNIQEPSGGGLEGSQQGREEVERGLLVCKDGTRSRELARDLSEGDLEVAWLEGGMDDWSGPLQPRPEVEYTGPKNKTLY